MTQFALPISDVTHTNWTEGAGDGDGVHFDELDEGFGAGRGSGSGPDDATTYWNQSTISTSFGSPINSQLGALTDPLSSTGHVGFNRIRKSASAGRQVDSLTELRQTTTLIVSSTEVNISDAWHNWGTGTLSAAQADSITDYTALRYLTYFRTVGGGTPRTGHESAQEFQCPDAGGASLPIFQRPLRIFQGRF